MVPDDLCGKKVRCNQCQEVFLAPHKKAAGAAEVEAIEPATEDRLHHRPEWVSPPRRRRPIEEDEEDERPRRRRKKQETKRESSALLLILIGVGAVILLLIVLGTLFFFSVSLRPAPENIAGAPPFPPANPVLPGNPIPDPMLPAPGVPVPAKPSVPAPEVAGSETLRYRWQGVEPYIYAVHVEVEQEQFTDIHDGNCQVRVQKVHRPRQPLPPEDRKGTGTGFVVNANGYLITCAHVVAHAEKIEVSLKGQTYAATVVARDETQDLAVLQIKAQNLQTLCLTDSDKAEVGQEVRALGFPLSPVLGENVKATRGTISGTNLKDGKKVFQIDASVNPGNSGGPLVTETGAVLGVNSAKLAGEAISNVGFAVPSNEVRRLLAGKGLAYETGGWTTRLDGPTLVKRVSEAVALITVTVGDRFDPDSFRLTCQGHLLKRQAAKGGMGPVIPVIPMGWGANVGTTTIEMEDTGRILQANGSIPLPMLLGEMGHSLIEPLPSDNRSTWEASNPCTIGERNGLFPELPFGMPRLPRPQMPFGPPQMPFGPPQIPFGPPQMPFQPGGGEMKTRQGQERCRYTRGGTRAGAATIKKHYELKVDGNTEESPGLHLVGDGQIAFDVKAGLPRTIDFQGTLTLSTTTTNERVPLKVSYKLLEGAAREQVLNPPPPPKVEPKSFTDADLTQVLADLKGTNKPRRMVALHRLGQGQPNPAPQ